MLVGTYNIHRPSIRDVSHTQAIYDTYRSMVLTGRRLRPKPPGAQQSTGTSSREETHEMPRCTHVDTAEVFGKS